MRALSTIFLVFPDAGLVFGAIKPGKVDGETHEKFADCLGSAVVTISFDTKSRLGNHSLWARPAGPGRRRFSVLRMSTRAGGQRHPLDFFQGQIHRRLNSSGAAWPRGVLADSPSSVLIG